MNALPLLHIFAAFSISTHFLYVLHQISLASGEKLSEDIGLKENSIFGSSAAGDW